MTEQDFTADTSEVHHPTPAMVAGLAHPDYLQQRSTALQDPVGFWRDRATELLDWFEPFSQTLDASNAPFYKWFADGRTNICLNALDRHVAGERRDKVAFIWESEQGESQTWTFAELAADVNRFANVLKNLGVAKGDTVTIYMGRVMELIIAMLATTKLGAVHSVVYGGFSEQALASRIEDCQSKVLVTCDGAWLRGKTVDLKDIADAAMKRCPIVQSVVVCRRTGQDIGMEAGRDHWWHDLMASAAASEDCPTEVMEAEDPLFILYTSGTTGRPKGVLHTHGGYQVQIATTLSYAFDLGDNDVWWCAADPGWITGHSYIVYGPLILGATSVVYEGAPGYPEPDRWWEIVDRYSVTILYTAPTAIRGLMRFGDEWPLRHRLDTLRLLGTVGEPINPEAWRWYHRVIGKGNCPVIDTWWQTETGGFMITPTPAVPLKPGSATLPFIGVIADVVDEDGNPCADNEEGSLVIKHPWPGMLRTVWGDPDRYVEQYWSEFSEQGWYFPGDSARRDPDGYIWVIGRMDDVIKVSGYRLGTAEIESALVSHEVVAEAAVIGLPDELRGNRISAHCILNDGVEPADDLSDRLKRHVRAEVGPIAVPQEIHFTASLPKTRSGKIMRRLLKAQALGQPLGDTSTLEE
ncbi:MAG: acetate--CoA ligase [Caldilineaceae bacterium SB0665_bin_21]|nr:acetate--CoA ligase [Caldilineaceae bacterium SB0665_bin_21]MYA05404.1 acetate--CoA ligase [Caldilineaceae bacterium SB0664_bin_22]MYC62088.1 acetate--CoA ligase [Caldilineaceae bacterium SB0661_bin_34]